MPVVPNPAMILAPVVLAYRLRCLSDDLTRLAHAVPEAEREASFELLRARDAIWFAAQRMHPLRTSQPPTRELPCP